MSDPALLPTPGSRLNRPNRHSKIDVAKALKMRVQGATLAECGEMQGVSPQAIEQALRKFAPFVNGLQPGELSAYSQERAELFNVVEQHLTASLLDPDTLAKASLNNRAYAFKQIHEARRLEQGASTSNVSVLGKLILQAEVELGTPPIDKSPKSTPPVDPTS